MLGLGFEAQAQAATAKAATGKSYNFEVPATKQWVDTKLDMRGGAKLSFAATGNITYPSDNSYSGKLRTSGTFGPAGLPRNWADLVPQYAVRNAGMGR